MTGDEVWRRRQHGGLRIWGCGALGEEMVHAFDSWEHGEYKGRLNKVRRQLWPRQQHGRATAGSGMTGIEASRGKQRGRAQGKV